MLPPQVLAERSSGEGKGVPKLCIVCPVLGAVCGLYPEGTLRVLGKERVHKVRV